MPVKQKDGRWLVRVNWTDRENFPNAPHRQKKKLFPSKTAAEAWKKSFMQQLQQDTTPLTDAQVSEYHHACSLLPDSMTLVDAVMAVNDLKKTQAKYRATIQEAADLYLKEKKISLNRQASIIDVRQKMNVLTKWLGSTYVDEVRPSMLLEILTDMKVHGTTRNNYRKHWRMFFDWCVNAGYTTDSPAKAITRTATNEATPPIFNAKQVQAVFDAIYTHPDIHELLHYQALAFFAGIRPAELKRLDYSNIQLDAGKIHITPDIAKTRSQGYIDIHPNLASMLQGCPTSGPVWPHSLATHRRRHKKLIEYSGVEWSPDVARHSYASHLLALKKDAAYVRFQLRHDTDDILFRHYIAVVTKEDAEKYFLTTIPASPLLTN